MNGRNMRQEPPVKVGEELDVKIEAVGEKGDGIAKKDGFVLFIPGVKEGDEVRVRVTKVLRRVGFAEVVGEGAPAPAEEAPAEEEAGAEEQPAEEAPAEEEKEEASSEDTETFGEEEAKEEEPEAEMPPIPEEEEKAEEAPEEPAEEEKKE